MSSVMTPSRFLRVAAIWLAIALAAFAASMCVSGRVGAVGIEWTAPWRVAELQIRGRGWTHTPLATDADRIAFDALQQRLPRVLAAGLVGLALAAAGVTLQALLRNPLADPYVLGISSGSTVGVMAWMLLPVLWPGLLRAIPREFLDLGRSLPAVAGALATCFVVFLLARRRGAGGGAGGGMDPVTLLLVGVVVSSINAALLLVLNSLAPAGLKANLASYMMGLISENDLTPALLSVAAIVLAAGYLPVLLSAAALNIGTLSDTEAVSLGVNVQRLRTLCFLCASVMTGAAILISGPIGFVGLICPHICRRLKGMGGADHRILLIAAPLCGAAFLMLADSAVRVAATLNRGEFPVGVVTALCGGPFFLILLRRRSA
jgi:iron complex transport system permease protein